MKSVDCDSVHQVGELIALYNNCLRRRRTDILYVGESTKDVGEQGVGLTRRRNDRNSFRPPPALIGGFQCHAIQNRSK